MENDRTTDPTTGTIALQLNDTNGITINRAATHNLTCNSISNIAAETNSSVWGDMVFQHASSIKDTLNGSDYDFDIRNDDTDRAINLVVGAIGSTPEVSVQQSKISMLGHTKENNIVTAKNTLIDKRNSEFGGNGRRTSPDDVYLNQAITYKQEVLKYVIQDGAKLKQHQKN